MSTHPGQTWDYRTKVEAVAAAVAAAQTTWNQKKIPCNVRIQLANGQWQEERTYGNDPFPPKG